MTPTPPIDSGSSLSDKQQEPGDRAWRANWLLSTVWLIFVCFPVFSVIFNDQLGVEQKVAATAIALVFVVVYALGFRQAIQCAHDPAGPSFGRAAWLYLAVLALLTSIGLVVAGWGMLGLMPYLVSFAVFNLGWTAVLVIAPLCLVFTVAGPLLAGVYDDLWILTPVTFAVAIGMVLIRIVDGRERNRAILQTELVVSDERDRVARDVHDVLGHSLTAVVLKAELAERLLQQVTPSTDAEQAAVDRCGDELVELQAISRRALAEIRSTVGGLRNPTLTDEVSVARTVLADGGVTLTVLGDPAEVPDQYRSTLAWVVRESVTNIVRHAKAANCEVEFGAEANSLLRITDDGVGLDSSGDEGNGLRGLRERALAVGVGLKVESLESGGTRVEVRA